ncbi:MAG: hypothetical protein P8X63_06390 [Desulfuromonadaceae bacterium]
MSLTLNSTACDLNSAIHHILSVARSDTAYWDRYIFRARQLLSPKLSYLEYRNMEKDRASSALIPDQIRSAMEAGDWQKTQELSSRLAGIREKFDDQRPLIELGQLLYDAPHQTSSAPLANAQLQQEAIDAFKQGKFDQLERLAGKLQDLNHTQGMAKDDLQDEIDREAQDLLFNFSAETLKTAKQLGLEPVQAESWHTRYGHLCRFAWHPAIGREGSLPGEAQQVFDRNLPADTPEGMKERIRMFMIHPFVNSGGSRYLPDLVAEDYLVEDFPEPQPGQPFPDSPLLAALHLNRRDQLSRLTIEQALLRHGDEILAQLQLDPFQFRLVCIPPDLHLRTGQQKGWGQQPLWTHFDGYMIQRDSHRMALAGGDVRFGGVFDLVGIGVNYESDRVFARFAVVQRQRMLAW